MNEPLTYGLTHLALLVKDVDASITFYNSIFGVRVMYRSEGFGQVQTIGSNDILVFEEDKNRQNIIGESGGIKHFGFRLRNANDLELISRRIQDAGGKIVEKGEFCPGEPYVFFKDPDGYVIEVWYELEG